MKYYIVSYGEGTKFKDRFKAAKFLRQQLNFKGRLCKWSDWSRGCENAVYCCEEHFNWGGSVRIYRGNFDVAVERFNIRGDEVVVLGADKQFIGFL